MKEEGRERERKRAIEEKGNEGKIKQEERTRERDEKEKEG